MVLALSALVAAITDCQVCQELSPNDCTPAMVSLVAKTTEVEWICLKSTPFEAHTKDLNSTPIHTIEMAGYTLSAYTDNGNVVVRFPKTLVSWNYVLNRDVLEWSAVFNASKVGTATKFDIYSAFPLASKDTKLGYNAITFGFDNSTPMTSIVKTAYGYTATANLASNNGTYTMRGTLGKTDVCIMSCVNPVDQFFVYSTTTGSLNCELMQKFTRIRMSWDDLPGNTCTITADCYIVARDTASGLAIPQTDYSKNLDGNGSIISKKQPVKLTNYDFASVQCHTVSASTTFARLGAATDSATSAYSCINTAPVPTITIPGDMSTTDNYNVTVKCTATDFQFTWGGNITFWTNQTGSMTLANTSVCTCAATPCSCTRDLNFTAAPDGIYNISCNASDIYKKLGFKNITVMISRNTAPYAFNLNITPLGLNTFQNAFCAFTINDNQQSSTNVSIRFFIDDHVNPAYEYVPGQAYMVAYNNTANISTTSVPPGATLPGWSVRCDVNASDGITTSGWIIGPYTTYTSPPGGGGEGGGGGGGYTPPPPEDIEEGIEETGGQVSGELFGFDMSQITGLPWVIIVPLAIGGFFILLDDDDDDEEKGDKHGVRY